MMRPALADLCDNVRYREIVATTVPGWSAHNPSIAVGPDGQYRCNVRSSNYVFRNGQFIVTHHDGVIRTRNFLCDLNDDLGVENMEWVDDTAVTPEVQYTLVRNLEDGRLFYQDGSWYMLGNSREHRADGIPKIALDRLDGHYAVERTIFDGPDPWRCEKNWVPMLDSLGGTGDFLYSTLPTVTYNAEFDLMETQFDQADELPGIELRGGSQVIPVPGSRNFITVTHEVTWEPDRHYWHRFILFNDLMGVEGYSDPFYFLSPGTQFVAGLVAKDDDFVISFGHHESRALFASVPQANVLKAIENRTPRLT